MKKTNLKQENKSPLARYYGGKFNLSNKVVSLIPRHELYVEPFFGGGSVFFHKKRSKKEVINDLDSQLYRFWKICKERGYELYKRFDNFLKFEEEHRRAVNVLSGLEKPKDEIDFAYCYFVSINMGFKGIVGHKTFNVDIRTTIHSINLKIENINNMMLRLKNVLILNKKASAVVGLLDSKETFFYLDPPYPETTQQYANKHTMQGFNKLCELLKTIKGKFILSCYLKEGMRLDPKWNKKEIKTHCSISHEKNKKRTEALIYNFT